MSVIIDIVKRGDAAALAKFIAEDPQNEKLLHTCDNTGDTLLIAAVKLEHDAVVQVLLDNGAFVDDGNTFTASAALHAAAEMNSVAMIQMLLTAGADINARDDELRTPLHVAAAKCNVDAVRALIGSCADCGAACRKGWLALHYAARAGDHEILTLLCQTPGAGAHAACVDSVGRAPLTLAAINGNEDCVRTLAALCRPSVSFRDTNGRTPVGFAAVAGQTGAVAALIECGADVNARDGLRLTPILYAARSMHVDTVKHLLSAGAEVDEFGPDGNTLLHIATEQRSESLVELALFCGARRSLLRNAEGQSALHIAARGSWERGVALLLDWETSSLVTDFNGETALRNANTPQLTISLLQRCVTDAAALGVEFGVRLCV